MLALPDEHSGDAHVGSAAAEEDEDDDASPSPPALFILLRSSATSRSIVLRLAAHSATFFKRSFITSSLAAADVGSEDASKASMCEQFDGASADKA